MISESLLVPYSEDELPVRSGPWIVFAPHADDETFGMGGTLARATERGITVHPVIMTDGALGGDSEHLVQIRQAEAAEAAALLGLEAPVFLDNRDRELRIGEKTLNEVTGIITDVVPAAVFFPGPFELHPDHRAAAALVWQVLREADSEIVPVSYEVLVQSPVNSLVDITRCLDRKRAAMSVYESQLNENRYMDIALAMNRLRALTLGGGVSHAEGFYRFEPEDARTPFETLVLDKLKLYFRV